MKKLPNISDAEWQVMKILWAEDVPVTSNHVIDRLKEVVAWNPKTIRTLLGRLVKKKAIGYIESGNSYLYYPLLNEEECIKEETRSFLERACGGRFNVLMTNFLKEQELTEEEIEELKHILEKKKKKG
ncbi:BlaI/MecI/CopY family transcriptional regulator [Sinanaerobacter sp. ZZT-01]|uniref:BlaI/MecI/CopY family transcriptional regulator n=1 Tax=Sinanaerobacter sp. ZZT-01 TaxID=3111540 RepID=UPI002D7995E8|nr:BlaI/MecI/CopY family transcriptional regulator [Sinanaerobacter sp. ZZT-01]WRR92970.1 BlaI/MecI/CopY family transcriptional regulator [Sinanaerobacter sp. ZZT-01]